MWLSSTHKDIRMLNATGWGMRRVSSVHPANSTITVFARVDVPASHSSVSDQKDSSVTSDNSVHGL